MKHTDWLRTQLHPNNLIRDGKFMISRAWRPLLKQMLTAIGNQWVNSTLQTPATNTHWLAYTHEPAQSWVYKQGKWHAESYHYPDNRNRISLRNVDFYKSPEATVCPRKPYWILSPWKLQVIHGTKLRIKTWNIVNGCSNMHVCRKRRAVAGKLYYVITGLRGIFLVNPAFYRYCCTKIIIMSL